jgi:hypothetical protein
VFTPHGAADPLPTVLLHGDLTRSNVWRKATLASSRSTLHTAQSGVPRPRPPSGRRSSIHVLDRVRAWSAKGERHEETQRAELLFFRLEACLVGLLRAVLLALRPVLALVFRVGDFLAAVLLPAAVRRAEGTVVFAPRPVLAVVFLCGVFLAVLFLGEVVRREGREVLFVLRFARGDGFLGTFTLLLVAVFLRLEGVLGRFFDRFRISPTTAPTSPAPATASIGFSFTADAAFFVPFVLDEAALPTRSPLRETALVPPRAAR